MNNKIFGIPTWIWVVAGVIFYLHQNKSTERFAEMILPAKKPKVKIFNFNTEWCGWSKRFQPEWDEFSINVKSNPNIMAQDIKCDDPSNKSMCNNYNVPGFPTVVAEVNGKPIQYKGPRTAESLIEFVNNL